MEFLADNHPKVVHFAVAFLTVYPLLEILAAVIKKDYLDKAAHLILFLGVISAVGAVLTGQQAEEIAEAWEESGAIIPFGSISEHEQYATITLWYFTALLVIRTFLVIKKKFLGILRYGFLILTIIGMYFIYETAEHGGELVYKYGVGTELKKAEIEE